MRAAQLGLLGHVPSPGWGSSPPREHLSQTTAAAAGD
jgi:hypothetical protein